MALSPTTAAASFDEADSPRDFLREAFAGYEGKMPATRAEFIAIAFRLIDEALVVISGEIPDGSSLAAFGARATGTGQQDTIIRFLNLLRYARSSSMRLDAMCFLRILGDEGRSLDEIGEAAGLGPNKKGTVHKRYREIQRMLGDLPGRGDKSPVAREKYRRQRTGARRQVKEWGGRSAWSLSLVAA